jgi:hypothetical protein
MGWRTGSQYGIFPNLGFKQRSHLHCLHCLHCHVSRRNMEMSAVQKATRPSSWHILLGTPQGRGFVVERTITVYTFIS